MMRSCAAGQNKGGAPNQSALVRRRVKGRSDRRLISRMTGRRTGPVSTGHCFSSALFFHHYTTNIL